MYGLFRVIQAFGDYCPRHGDISETQPDRAAESINRGQDGFWPGKNLYAAHGYQVQHQEAILHVRRVDRSDFLDGQGIETGQVLPIKPQLSRFQIQTDPGHVHHATKAGSVLDGIGQLFRGPTARIADDGDTLHEIFISRFKGQEVNNAWLREYFVRNFVKMTMRWMGKIGMDCVAAMFLNAMNLAC